MQTELFYLTLQTEPDLAFLATFPVGDNSKTFHLPVSAENAIELVMNLLSQKSIANELWPKVIAILNEAQRQNAAEEVEFLRAAGVTPQ